MGGDLAKSFVLELRKSRVAFSAAHSNTECSSGCPIHRWEDADPSCCRLRPASTRVNECRSAAPVRRRRCGGGNRGELHTGYGEVAEPMNGAPASAGSCAREWGSVTGLKSGRCAEDESVFLPQRSGLTTSSHTGKELVFARSVLRQAGSGRPLVWARLRILSPLHLYLDRVRDERDGGTAG